ncbi:hypothetical protein MMC07_001737 [Pseudocyphellaria aurata]|nr:hypothetical protein [Pseudocyphellaria aurata]
MNFLEAIHVILQLHQQQGFYEERISAMLRSYRVTLPISLIRRIIGTLYHVQYGPIYGDAWAMWGFQFIVHKSNAGDTDWVICGELNRFGYLWDHNLVCQIMFVHHWWRELGNSDSG